MNRPLRYGSVCSGIEAASVAWDPLGWKPAWFCEIDPFASAVLAHRFPEVPNHGDFTQLLDPAHPVHAAEPIDLLVGGTPCQDFSVAGLRAGIDGDRGSLTLDFCRLVGVLRPRWVVWENVPGVLSSDGGRALGALLGALAELGYGFAWRVLDAQYFGLAQRRKRVFVVGCAGAESSRAGAVLLEPEGVRGDPPARRKAGEGAPAAAAGRAGGGGEARGVTISLQDTRGLDKAQNGRGWNEEGTAYTVDTHATQGVAVAFNGYQRTVGSVASPLMAEDYKKVEIGVIAFDDKQSGSDAALERAPTLRATPHANSWANGGGPVGIVNVEHGLHTAGNLDLREVSEPITASEKKGHSVVLQGEEPMTFDWQAGGGQTGEFQGGTRVYITDPPGRTRALNACKTLAVLQPEIVTRSLAFTTRGRDDGLAVESQDELAYALKNPGSGGRTNDRMIATEDAFAFQPRIARNGRGQPEPISPTLNGADAGATSDMRPCVVQPEEVWRQSCGCGHDWVGALHQPCPVCGEVRDGWTHGDPIALDTIGFYPTGGTHGVSAIEDRSPTLKLGTGSGGNPPGVCFKASHFTRGKDGAPSEVTPPLSADADRGDQDTLVFTGDGVVADPISANEGKTYTHEGTTFRMHNCVGQPPVSMRESGPGYWLEDEVSGTLDANMGTSGHANRVATLAQPPTMSVRRLTPRECERLQGFPDDWTLIPYRKGEASDSNRYRALGNSMAVPVMRWIGARIGRVDGE